MFRFYSQWTEKPLPLTEFCLTLTFCFTLHFSTFRDRAFILFILNSLDVFLVCTSCFRSVVFCCRKPLSLLSAWYYHRELQEPNPCPQLFNNPSFFSSPVLFCERCFYNTYLNGWVINFFPLFVGSSTKHRLLNVKQGLSPVTESDNCTISSRLSQAYSVPKVL